MTRLLIVDDEEPLRRSVARVLTRHGYECETACDAAEARTRIAATPHDVALLDVNMPGESGIRLLSHIRGEHPDCAVVMVTGEDSLKLATAAIEHGAYGYLIKPVEEGELVINVVNALRRRHLELSSRQRQQELHALAAKLDDRLAQTLQDLQDSQAKVWASQAETIFQLARVVEYRDEDTGDHLRRMSEYCRILGGAAGFSGEECERLRLASQLHDVGKVAIPDSILLKPGKLTDAEFETVKTHTEIGYKMLASSNSLIVQAGAQIARSHHERWDGSGYPDGIAGETIPHGARIAAIADVFDALTVDRVYRPAFPFDVAVGMMRAERGSHFDPELLDAFLGALPVVEATHRAYRTV